MHSTAYKMHFQSQVDNFELRDPQWRSVGTDASKRSQTITSK